jgi:hypothetical protein
MKERSMTVKYLIPLIILSCSINFSVLAAQQEKASFTKTAQPVKGVQPRQWQIPDAPSYSVPHADKISEPVEIPQKKNNTEHIPPHFTCQMIADQIEKDQGFPPQLLSAISLTETGGSRSIIPNQPKVFSTWPWTINVEGKGYTFKSKQEVINQVRQFQAMGKRSIDVGCMQVNLKFHPDAFDSLEEAFDPVVNVLYGASFIKNLSDRHGSWMKAVEYYHSGTPAKYNIYRELVFKNWQKERNRHTLVTAYKINQLIDQKRLERLKEVAKARAHHEEEFNLSSSDRL